MAQKGMLDLGMRLGEGSGAALAAVLAKTALHLHTNMATFVGAGVSGKEGWATVANDIPANDTW